MGTEGTAFQKWSPMENLDIGYDLDHIAWGTEGLVFTLIPDGPRKKQPNQKLRLIWDWSHVISYHVTDETYRADCWGLDFENEGRFYASKESEYLTRFREKSPLFPDDAIHFTLVGTNMVVDILAKEYPVAELEM